MSERNFFLRVICLSLWFSIGFSLLFTIKANATEDSTYIVSSVKVYSEANENSSVTANLIVGNAFEVYEAVNDDSGTVWYLISTDFGAAGYVKADELDALIAQTQAAVSTAEAAAENQEADEQAAADNAADNTEIPADNAVTDIEDADNTNSNADMMVVADDDDTQGERTAAGTLTVSDPVNQSTQAAEVQNIQEQTEEQTDSEFEVSGENAQTVKKSKSGFRIDLAAIGLIAGVLACIAAIAVLIRKILKLLRL